jgi:hemerythrin-like domain-containing protein
MNIFDLIEKDHEKVKALLEEIQENANDNNKRDSLLAQVKQALLAHNKAEESLIYKELEKRGYEKLALRSQEEHKLVEKFLENFKEDLSEDSFLAYTEILKNLISTHIEEEESETFEHLEEEFSEEDLDTLAEKFQQEKENNKQMESV